MQKILIASSNSHKISEMTSILQATQYQFLSLKDFPLVQMPAEDGLSFSENALIKARSVYQQTLTPCIADDSGLIVDALEGRPGIYSARYAGEASNDEVNLQKVLDELNSLAQNLKEWPSFTARFVCALAWVNQEEEKVFEGVLEGRIISEKRGEFGFGYDPIFFLNEFQKTSAELLPEEKNKISHRYLALNLFQKFLNK